MRSNRNISKNYFKIAQLNRGKKEWKKRERKRRRKKEGEERKRKEETGSGIDRKIKKNNDNNPTKIKTKQNWLYR